MMGGQDFSTTIINGVTRNLARLMGVPIPEGLLVGTRVATTALIAGRPGRKRGRKAGSRTKGANVAGATPTTEGVASRGGTQSYEARIKTFVLAREGPFTKKDVAKALNVKSLKALDVPFGKLQKGHFLKQEGGRGIYVRGAKAAKAAQASAPN